MICNHNSPNIAKQICPGCGTVFSACSQCPPVTLCIACEIEQNSSLTYTDHHGNQSAGSIRYYLAVSSGRLEEWSSMTDQERAIRQRNAAPIEQRRKRDDYDPYWTDATPVPLDNIRKAQLLAMSRDAKERRKSGGASGALTRCVVCGETFTDNEWQNRRSHNGEAAHVECCDSKYKE